MRSKLDILDRLFGLHKLHPNHFDRNYLDECLRCAILEILYLREALKQTKQKQQTGENKNENSTTL